MAKKKDKNDELDIDRSGDDEEEKGNKFVSILIALAIIVIWLVIFAILIKMDVGGVGTMLRPVLKNVPVINRVLPDSQDNTDNEEYKYKSMSEAVDRIKELEQENNDKQNQLNQANDQIQQLQAEVDRLKVYEDQQDYFLQQKEQFDKEVVNADNAPDISEYKKWYEQISPDNAAEIYKDVCRRIQFSQQVQDWATTYATMDPSNAAAIMQEMTGDAYIVSRILLCMTPKQRSAVMAAMDPVYAGKLTKVMFPTSA